MASGYLPACLFFFCLYQLGFHGPVGFSLQGLTAFFFFPPSTCKPCFERMLRPAQSHLLIGQANPEWGTHPVDCLGEEGLGVRLQHAGQACIETLAEEHGLVPRERLRQDAIDTVGIREGGVGGGREVCWRGGKSGVWAGGEGRQGSELWQTAAIVPWELPPVPLAVRVH